MVEGPNQVLQPPWQEKGNQGEQQLTGGDGKWWSDGLKIIWQLIPQEVKHRMNMIQLGG